MEQVPHWLEITVFAAGMTAYANEVEAKDAAELALPANNTGPESEARDSYH